MLETLDRFELHPHDEVLAVHRRNFPEEFRRQRPGQRGFWGPGRASAWTWVSSCTRDRKSAGAEGNVATDLDPLRLLAEEVEVEAEVEDSEVLLVVPGSEQIVAQSRAAPDHLPELDARVDRLEEDQVRNLGNVDAGIEHIDRDRDVGRLVLLREIIEQALRILGVIVDDAGKMPGVLRVVVIEPLLDMNLACS